jgi:hypothetical protein
MKKLILIAATVAGLAMITTSVVRAEGGKEITIKGEAKCAKCALGQGDECQTVVQRDVKGKVTTYYLADNAVSKKFHKQVCKETKPASVTGVCRKVEDKLVVTASKIELAN